MARQQSFEQMARSVGRDYSSNFERRKREHPVRASKARIVETESQPEIVEASGFSFSRLLIMAAAILLTLSVILYAAAHYFGTEIAQGGHTLDQKPVEVVIGNTVLDIPANMIRFSNQRYSGDHKKLELYLHWPSLAGYTADTANDFNDVKDLSKIVFLTIEPRNMAYDMSGRIEPIYSRYFTGPVEDAGHGLVRRPLSAQAGFLDEYLYYEKDSPYPFAARCIKPGSSIGEPICIRDVLIDKSLTLTYRFNAELIADWMRLDQSIRKRIKSFIAKVN